MTTSLEFDCDYLVTHIRDNWLRRQIVSNRQQLTPEFIADPTYINHIKKWVTSELAELLTDYIILDHVLRWGVDTHHTLISGFSYDTKSTDPMMYMDIPKLIEAASQVTSMESRFLQPAFIAELRAIVIPRMEHT